MSEARLHVSDSQGRRVVVLDRPQFLIGRRTAADLQIVSTDVSREHAEIVQDEGRYLLRDRGSRYGTFVNGEQVTERVLEHGDRIRLGRTDAIELVFATDGAKTTGFLDTSSDVTNLRQMAAILNGLRALGSGRVLDEVLTLVMDSAIEVTKAERGFMMLANAEGELEFKIARGTGTDDAARDVVHDQREDSARSVSNRAEPHRRRPDGRRPGRAARRHDRGRHSPRAVRAAAGEPMSAATAPRRSQKISACSTSTAARRARMLSDATRASLEAFATQAAMAIDSARLYAESAEKARIDRDLRVAADIQRALLPEPSYETASAISPRRSCLPDGRRRLLRLPGGRRAGSHSRWAMSRARARRPRCLPRPCRATSPRRRR